MARGPYDAPTAFNVRRCPQCRMMCDIDAQVCPHCLRKFPRKKADQEFIEGMRFGLPVIVLGWCFLVYFLGESFYSMTEWKMVRHITQFVAFIPAMAAVPAWFKWGWGIPFIWQVIIFVAASLIGRLASSDYGEHMIWVLIFGAIALYLTCPKAAYWDRWYGS